MYSDNQKNEFSLLSSEGKPFNSICNIRNNLGFSSISNVTLSKKGINIHNKFLRNENKIYLPDSVKKSKSVAPNDLVMDVIDEYKPYEKNSGESNKMSYFCHIFERFYKIYVIVLSIT